jgi:hypothetical protein
MLPHSLIAAAAARVSLGPAPAIAGGSGPSGWRRALVGVGIAAAIAALFYSSVLAHPAAILAPLGAAPTYVQRGVDAGVHVHPWHYDHGLLAWTSAGGLHWTEGLVLVLASIGGGAAWARRDGPPDALFWRRFLTANALISLAIFSAIPYKTPWNLLPFHAAIVVAAGVGVAALARLTASSWMRAALAAGVAAGALHLGWQAWRASVVYASDPRNPYVYSQTVPDAVRMAARIRDLAALHRDHERMLVMVIAGPHEQWPLPWYLRTMPHVGYWTDAASVPTLDAPVIVAASEQTATLDAALGDRYVSEFFGVRPDVLLTLYVERGLWDRFLARAQLGGS